MGFFRGEKYSKEAYKDAESDLSAATRKFQEFKHGPNTNPINVELYEILFKKGAQAEERLRKLHGKSQAEASKLNEEYTHLLAEAQEAIKAVEKFEEEKLEMSREN